MRLLLTIVLGSVSSASLISLGDAQFTGLHELHSSLVSLQDQYFSLWLGKWTTAIDWTAAVTNTYILSTLSSLSRSENDYVKLEGGSARSENEISKYFAQSTAFYYNEDAFAIRTQAYDDMLWVVLEWLESLQFITSHSESHYSGIWHAQQFKPAFAHRARVFYELAERGWDDRLCGGGMLWNPRLQPYKNAITNQLFISASASMYLHFPGDTNCSPFVSCHDSPRLDFEVMRDQDRGDCDGDSSPRGRYDQSFLKNAVLGYRWIKSSNMTNAMGLYTDGFHISGYGHNNGTTCDARNEMVYTYNQGVVLSGLRDLWEGTGHAWYLDDGHELVRNVISATGWKLNESVDRSKEVDFDWYGLGSNGILTELCDPSGTCSQDGQTFKGIFFHHLMAFCNQLPRRSAKPGRTHRASKELAAMHRGKCASYTSWVTHNARAALRTRDRKGRFGGWWGVESEAGKGTAALKGHEAVQAYLNSPDAATSSPITDATDYRNHPVDFQELNADPVLPLDEEPTGWSQRHFVAPSTTTGDANDRGRGRTLETQGGGLAVVKAMYEFLRWRRDHQGVRTEENAEL